MFIVRRVPLSLPAYALVLTTQATFRCMSAQWASPLSEYYASVLERTLQTTLTLH